MLPRLPLPCPKTLHRNATLFPLGWEKTTWFDAFALYANALAPLLAAKMGKGAYLSGAWCLSHSDTP